MFAVVVMEVSFDSPVVITLEEAHEVLQEFLDIFPTNLLDHLPPLRDIQHVIAFVPGAFLSNLSHYRMNPSEHPELQCQVGELCHKEFICERLSPCTVPALLTHKCKKYARKISCLDNYLFRCHMFFIYLLSNML